MLEIPIEFGPHGRLDVTVAGAEADVQEAVTAAPLHIHSTMRIGEVTDTACEAKGVDRLFIADHSVLGNSLGGPSPTNTGQALAIRTAEKLFERYFAGR